MDKMIKECTAQELIKNIEYNKNNQRFGVTLDGINAMYDYLKSQPSVRGNEVSILEYAFSQLKLRLDRTILETIVHIEKS